MIEGKSHVLSKYHSAVSQLKGDPMSLYPQGHPPFRPRGTHDDTIIQDAIAEIARLPLPRALGGATVSALMLPLALEQLRAHLFRAEQLAAHESLRRDEHSNSNPEWLPILVPDLIERLEATRRCLEEWLESQTCAKLTKLRGA
jgi:hypothetical protein